MTANKASRARTLQQVSKLRITDFSGDTDNVKPPISNRCQSILLTPFSTQEWKLASSIAELMEIIAKYPDVPIHILGADNVRKPSQVVVTKASLVVASVKQLSASCMDAITSGSKTSVDHEIVGDLKHMKAQLHQATVRAVDRIKEYLVNAKKQDESMKTQIVDYLVEITNQANEMIEYSSAVLKNNRESDTQTRVEPSLGATGSSPQKKSLVEPDGEGMAVAVRSSAVTQGISCRICALAFTKQDFAVRYIGEYFHKSCFKCCNCHGSVNNMSFLTYNDDPICIKCSPRCGNCFDPIVADCFIALDSMFHLACFKCSLCKDTIPPEDKFYRKNDKACCVKCMSNPRESVFQKLPKFPIVTEKDSSAKRHSYGRDRLQLSNLAKDSAPLLSPINENAPSQSKSPIPPPRNKLANFSSGNGDPAALPMPVPPRRKGSITSQTSVASSDTESNTTPSRPQPAFPIRSRSDSKDSSYSSEDEFSSSASKLNMRTLNGILSTEFGLETFIQFCTEEFCVEKVFFWMDVEEFKNMVDSKPLETMKYAKLIYEKYIKAGAELEIVLHPKILRAIEICINSGQIADEIFDQPQTEVFEEMETKLVPKFLDSSHGHRYLQSTLLSQSQTKARSRNPSVSGSSLSSTYNNTTPAQGSKDPLDIVSMFISKWEKKYKPEKHYVYDIKVVREYEMSPNLFPDYKSPKTGPGACSNISRSHEEFQDLHVALGRYFPDMKNSLPYMPGKHVNIFKLGRGGKAVARELNEYLEGLMKMGPKVYKSIIMYEFLKPNKDDLEKYGNNTISEEKC